MAAPAAPKPRIISAQVEASGTCAVKVVAPGAKSATNAFEPGALRVQATKVKSSGAKPFDGRRPSGTRPEMVSPATVTAPGARLLKVSAPPGPINTTVPVRLGRRSTT